MVFPSQYADEVSKLVDGRGQKMAARAMNNPRFVQAVGSGNWTLAGTFFHSAAAEEARFLPASALPAGWTLTAEKTLKPGLGGSRADLYLEGPGGKLVEFDRKTTGKSGRSTGSRKEMVRHSGQITINTGSSFSRQESISWFDYVRPLLGKGCRSRHTPARA
jgi:hypothetical protein